MQQDLLASRILAAIRSLGPNTTAGFGTDDLLPLLPGTSESELVEELKQLESHGHAFRIANNRYTLPTPQAANPAASLVSDVSEAGAAPANSRARRYAIIGGVALLIVMLLVLGPFRGS